MPPEVIEPTTDPAETASLAEHERQFGGGETPTPEPSPTPEPTPEPVPKPDDEPEDVAAASRPRDESGRFTAEKKTHRAAKAAATKEDVPRIAELTRRLREVEAERDALKTARPISGDRPTDAVVPTPARPASGPARPEKPNIKDFEDYGDFVEALSRYTYAVESAQEREKQAAEAERTRLSTSWRDRVSAARETLPDFEEVAFQRETPIPQGSLVDAWILEDEAGALILYELHKNRAELDKILAMPSALAQAKALSLLSQRLLPASSRSQADPTGAAVSATVKPGPRPPTPVRTGPVRAVEEPPDDEHASVADHEKWFGPQRHSA